MAVKVTLAWELGKLPSLPSIRYGKNLFTCGGATRSIAPQRYRQLLRTWFNIWTPIPQIKPFIIERQFINGGLGTILSQSPFKKFCPIPYLCHILSKIISHWGIGTFINQVPFFHRHPLNSNPRGARLKRQNLVDWVNLCTQSPKPHLKTYAII